LLGEALKRGEVSPPCKAEIEKRAAQCVNDPEAQKIIKNPAYKISDGEAWCQYQAFWHMCNQLDPMMEKKEQQAKAAKAAAEAQAALEKVEVPKGSMKNAALEKAVALAFQKDYSGKVLKVILDGWLDEFEKDAFGRVTGRDLAATVVVKKPDGKCQLHDELWVQQGKGRSFSGSLSARGAGSAKDTEILCSKVETASAAPARKKGK